MGAKERNEEMAARIEALQQRIRDKLDNQLVNMVLDNLGKNLHIAAALYRAYLQGCIDTNWD